MASTICWGTGVIVVVLPTKGEGPRSLVTKVTPTTGGKSVSEKFQVKHIITNCVEALWEIILTSVLHVDLPQSRLRVSYELLTTLNDSVNKHTPINQSYRQYGNTSVSYHWSEFLDLRTQVETSHSLSPSVSLKVPCGIISFFDITVFLYQDKNPTGDNFVLPWTDGLQKQNIRGYDPCGCISLYWSLFPTGS